MPYPYVSNPLYTGGQARGEATAAKIAESLGSIFGGGDPVEMAKIAALGSGSRKDLALAALSEDELSARQNLGSVFDNFTTKNADGTSSMVSEPDFRAKTIAALPALIRAGEGANVRDILAIPGIASGNDNLASMGSLFVRSQGPNDTFSLADRENVASRMARDSLNEETIIQQLKNAGDLAVENAKPLSTDQLEAQQLQAAEAKSPGMLSEVFLENLVGDVQPRQVRLPDGTASVAIGARYRDASGNLVPIPMGAQVFSTTAQPKTGAELTGLIGLNQPVETEVQKRVIGLKRAATTAKRIADRISPENTGLFPTLLDTPEAGWARQLAPGIVDEVTGSAGLNIPNLQVDRAALLRDVQNVRTAIVNETGKFTDKDQALVDRLASIVQGKTDAPTTKRLWEEAIDQWLTEAEADYQTLSTGITPPAAPGGKIRMKDPITGETGSVDPSEREEAEQNGWVVVP